MERRWNTGILRLGSCNRHSPAFFRPLWSQYGTPKCHCAVPNMIQRQRLATSGVFGRSGRYNRVSLAL